ncbi:MAG: aminoglycoside phosphotransferase [Oceanospirillales bacterium]|nr:MAG: aminoglycoside phosphotransferase [Oceanospirillales bacterium]
MTLLTQSSPDIDLQQVAEIASIHYGLKGEINPLPGERDANFRLRVNSQQQYMLRFINAAESTIEVEFQIELLRYLEDHATDLPIPKLVPTLSGEDQPMILHADQQYRLRMVSYLEGTPLYLHQGIPQLASDLGVIIARLDRVLTGFTHLGAKRDLLWDITYPQRLLDHIDCLQDQPLADLVLAVINRHTEQVLPHLDSVPWQVSHNDLNPHNVLVSPDQQSISGIIDFGDALYAPRVNNLATALSYQWVDQEDPLICVRHFLSTYQKHMPLNAEELKMLPVLIATRMCLTLLITSWRAALYPENREYILRNFPLASRSLRSLSRLPDSWIDDLLINHGVSNDRSC